MLNAKVGELQLACKEKNEQLDQLYKEARPSEEHRKISEINHKADKLITKLKWTEMKEK